jgi:predicted nuclease of predicted toxin-antitoxin system
VRLLANENFPLPSVTAIAEQGHDVLSISIQSPGITDEKVLARAHADNRILITFDRDYGMLVYFRQLPCPPGIIYLRLRPRSPVEAADLVLPVLKLGKDFLHGHFVVLERDACRRRPLPKSAQ